MIHAKVLLKRSHLNGHGIGFCLMKLKVRTTRHLICVSKKNTNYGFVVYFVKLSDASFWCLVFYKHLCARNRT